MLSLCCHRPLPRRARSIARPPRLLLPYGPSLTGGLRARPGNRQAPSGSPGSSSNWIYRTAAQGTNALRAWSSSAPSSLIASTVIPPALLSTNLASKPRPLANLTATRFPFHSLDKYPANAPPLSAYDLRASYPYLASSRPSWDIFAPVVYCSQSCGRARCVQKGLRSVRTSRGMRSRDAERSLALEPISMESAVPSVKWKTTASAACIPRRDSTSPYSMAATVFPTDSRIVCSLSSGLGGPIILGCSPLLACWLSIPAPSASC